MHLKRKIEDKNWGDSTKYTTNNTLCNNIKNTSTFIKCAYFFKISLKFTSRISAFTDIQPTCLIQKQTFVRCTCNNSTYRFYNLNFMICIVHQILFKIEKNEIGWECSTYEGEERLIQSSGRENFMNICKLQVEATINHKLCSLNLSQLSSQQTLYR